MYPASLSIALDGLEQQVLDDFGMSFLLEHGSPHPSSWMDRLAIAPPHHQLR